MTLYHLSENLCLQQRREEERRCLQKWQVGGPQRYLDKSNEAGTASLHCMCHSTTSSPGEMANMHHRSSGAIVLGDAHQGAEQTHAEGSSIPLIVCQGNSLQQHRLLAALGVASYWILLCVSERSCGRIDKTLLHLDEGKHMGLLWLIKGMRPCKESSALITENSWN